MSNDLGAGWIFKEKIMDIITQNGMRKHVDIESDWSYEKCALVSEDTYLKDVWIVELNTSNEYAGKMNGGKINLEFNNEFVFDHEPTKDEIMRLMVIEGMTIFHDIAIVRHGYYIERERD